MKDDAQYRCPLTVDWVRGTTDSEVTQLSLLEIEPVEDDWVITIDAPLSAATQQRELAD